MPTLTIQPATGVDSYLSESAQSANFGATDNIVAGNIHATGVDYSHRIVLQFDATDIPAYASVSSAVLTLDAISGSGISSTTFTAHRVTSTWTHLGVTWLTRDGSTAWTSSGGDYVALAADTTTAATSTSDLVFSSLAALVTDAIQNRSGIVYVMVKGPEDTGSSSFLNLVSSHNATGEKPKLVVTYTVPTFTIADNGDGTGAVATIGGTSGAANSVLVASWSGTSSTGWLSGGSRTGDGTVALSLDAGYYWAILLVDSLPRGLVYFHTTSSSYSVHYQCALATQTAIRNLALTGVDSDDVVVQKLPWDQKNTGTYPKIVIATAGTESMARGAGTNIRDDVGYPVIVSIFDRDEETLTSNHSRNLLWRQSIARAMRNQSVSGVTEVFDCILEPGAIVDPGWFNQNTYHSTFVLRFLSREVRGT